MTIDPISLAFIEVGAFCFAVGLILGVVIAIITGYERKGHR